MPIPVKANSLLTAQVCGFSGGLGGVSAMDRTNPAAAADYPLAILPMHNC